MLLPHKPSPEPGIRREVHQTFLRLAQVQSPGPAGDQREVGLPIPRPPPLLAVQVRPSQLLSQFRPRHRREPRRSDSIQELCRQIAADAAADGGAGDG